MLYFIWTALCLTLVASHGLMSKPPQRGCTNGNQYVRIPILDKNAKKDYSAHFPAGSKSQSLGAGLWTQKQAAGWRGWTPYEPWRKSFRWRAGVCGDTTWGKDHLRGGRYYNGGKIAANYPVNGVIDLDVTVTAHHNGFFEFWVCDIARCGGEISPKCFQWGLCHQLKRVWDKSCESRRDWRCAPIDPKYPGRWYLPCTRGKHKIDYYGKGKMRYYLPKNLRCKHCVLQWYWASGNSCNPPGLVNYFKGPRHPRWGKCWGQGDARGGWRRWEAMCKGRRFTEEYYQCADISIGGGGRRSGGGYKKQPAVQPARRKDWWGRNRGPMAKLIVYNFGKPVRTVYHGQKTWIKLGRRYNQISLLMITLGKSYWVHFYLNDRKWYSAASAKAPRYSGKFSYWKKPWYGAWFKVSAATSRSIFDCRIYLRR